MWRRFRSLDTYGQAAIVGAVLFPVWGGIAGLFQAESMASPLTLAWWGVISAATGAFLGVVFWWIVVEQRIPEETGERKPPLGVLMFGVWPAALFRGVYRLARRRWS